MKRLTITLDQSWVLSQRNAGKLPGQVLAEAFREKGFRSTVSGFTMVIIDFPDTTMPETVRQELARIMTETYGMPEQEQDKILRTAVETLEDKPEEKKQNLAELLKQTSNAQPGNQQAAGAESGKTEATQEEPPKPSVMESLHALIGAEELVAVCEKINNLAPLLKSRNLSHVLTDRSYLFSVDQGYGLTTALTLLSQLLIETELMKLRPDPIELKLDAESSRTDALADALKDLERVKNRVVCIDISNWMDKTTTPEFRDFLARLQKRTDQLIYVFRVPYLEREALHRIDAAISDVMLLDTVSFAPLSHDQLCVIASRVLEGYGFTATDDAWELFLERLAEEKSDGRFYGTKTAKKVVDEMIFLKLQSILETGVENAVIDTADLRGMVRAQTQISAAERLERMVGIDKIRDRIYEIIGQIEFARKNQGVNAPAMHMRFVGNPGTGKTTVARIVGQLLKERKILSRGYFFEHTGGDFLGMYVGHTSPKTLALCRDAYGSVLFIDEAYTLADANYSSGSGFAKEAVDTLIAQMENHREDLVVIMAGYPREMQRLMDMNPGLSGRMPYELVFPNYTREELAEIFLRMVSGDGFTCGEGVEAEIRGYFRGLDNSVLEDKNFANARFARNLFERTWSKTVMRAQLDGSDPKTIILADFRSAANEDARVIGEKQVKHSRPGYRLGLI